MNHNTPTPSSTTRATRARHVALGFVFLWFFFGGIAHFVFTDAEMRIVPPWLPFARALVLLTGVLELAGAAALLLPATRRLAGLGLFALTIAVTPANVYMLQAHAQFDVPYWLLVARLPFQVILLGLIAWSAILRPAHIVPSGR